MTGDLSKRMDDFERNADALRQVSEVLTGHVRVLMAEGWTEAQARDLVVALEIADGEEAMSGRDWLGKQVRVFAHVCECGHAWTTPPRVYRQRKQ